MVRSATSSTLELAVLRSAECLVMDTIEVGDRYIIACLDAAFETNIAWNHIGIVALNAILMDSDV
jgi:hypothetical protein